RGTAGGQARRDAACGHAGRSTACSQARPGPACGHARCDAAGRAPPRYHAVFPRRAGATTSLNVTAVRASPRGLLPLSGNLPMKRYFVLRAPVLFAAACLLGLAGCASSPPDTISLAGPQAERPAVTP